MSTLFYKSPSKSTQSVGIHITKKFVLTFNMYVLSSYYKLEILKKAFQAVILWGLISIR